jgi:hypothetical protein
MRKICIRFELIIILLISVINGNAENIVINNQQQKKQIIFGNSKLTITLDYNQKCCVSGLTVNGQTVISGKAGIYSEIKTAANNYSTRKLTENPIVKTAKNTVSISGIKYGEADKSVTEKWDFTITETNIEFEIKRNVAKDFTVEEIAFPSFNFDNINTWNGAFLGYGGLAWFYLFNEKLCTYGVHTDQSVFWNSTTGNALKVDVTAEEQKVAMKFSRSEDDKLVYNIAVSDKELTPRYEAEKRSRFIRKKTDVWEPFSLLAGTYTERITLTGIDYNVEYNRGKLAGFDTREVTDLLNTISRIGVIDEKLFGGNSWHTPYGPICLHEQYIAQFAIGINDETYTNGYKQCLDYYRDNAIQPDGRVLARWAYLNEDAIAGSVNKQGFYEAQWGYLLDSNPDFVSNVAQLFDLTGDLKWVSGHKTSCEKVLDFMLKRDSNGNHLIEMMSDSKSDKKGSDWIDIIWASYENAFVNAKLYYALTLWANVEKQLNDIEKAGYYAGYAAELKKSFNKSTDEGGLWNAHNRWYIHWREADNSIHGDNLVVPVNLMSIVYGICDDTIRTRAILDKIEEQTSKENLFFWPICLYPYTFGEGNDWQFPFPNYENGDIFLSWGSIGVEAYANYKPELALKYVENVLSQYKKDGLAFQRYGRVKQDGLGDDILSGNSLSLVGLYKAIYGINPLFNRLYLNPHITEKLSGTELLYNFRNDKLKIGLSTGNYFISNNQFKVECNGNFGFFTAKNEVYFFNRNEPEYALKAQTSSTVTFKILNWIENEYSWIQTPANENAKISYIIHVPKIGYNYVINLGTKTLEGKSDENGYLKFELNSNNQPTHIWINVNG